MFINILSRITIEVNLLYYTAAVHHGVMILSRTALTLLSWETVKWHTNILRKISPTQLEQSTAMSLIKMTFAAVP